MTKDELKEKIKVLVKQVYKPEILTGNERISLDAAKFPNRHSMGCSETNYF